MRINTHTFLSLAALALAASLAPAQNHHPLQPNEHETNLPGVTTIEAPPAGFDPLTASDQDLAYHGFPPRPDQNANPKGYAHWARAMSASKTRIVPQLEQTGIFHTAKGTVSAGAQNNVSAPPLPTNNPTITNPGMSGVLNMSSATSYGPSSFYYLVSEFVVPPVLQAPPPGCTGGYLFASAWAGIDGWGSSDILQAGIEFDPYCSGPTRTTYYSAWYEWYPYGEVRISSFPIAPGDDIFVEVWNTSATAGHAYLVNYNNNQVVNISFSAPPGTRLVGNSAEWIVDDPVVGGSEVAFSMIPFIDCVAYTQAGTLYDVATGTLINEPIPATPTSPAFTITPNVIGPESFVDVF